VVIHTPLDWASLSLNGSELPPPTVGGSPLTSGGHVALLSGGGVAVDCASDTFVVTTVTTVTNAAMIGTTERKGNSFRVCRAY
jgi:NADPH-dependent glutamate synthase beta subunit-like oxidoreductase